MIAIGGAALAAMLGAPLWLVFAAVAVGLVFYGVAMGALTAAADWSRRA